MTRSFTLVYPHLPPSDNHIREVKTITVRGGGRFGKKRNLKNVIGYTTDAENYKKEFITWIDDNYFEDIQRFTLGHLPTDVYDLEVRLYFEQWDLLNKGWLKIHRSDSKPGAKSPHKKGERHAKSPYKKLDTLNRRKLIEDALSEALDVDDSLTWEANLVKLLADERGPRVVMTLTQRDPRTFGVPEAFLETR